MKNILIIYSTSDGHTRKICERIKDVLLEQNQKVNVVSVDDYHSVKFDFYDKIIVGASIRYGKHSVKISRFIEEHVKTLDAKPNAFFSVNLVARKQEKCEPTTNPYLIKFLSQIPWKPKNLAVFAGKVDYPSYKILDRLMIQLIMWMTKGPTDPKSVIEYTDWNQVEQFAMRMAHMESA